MKRLAILTLVALFCLPVWAQTTLEAHPCAITLAWDAVEGASFYDIYLDDAFVVRLSDGETAWRIDGLEGWRDYKVSWAARDVDNKDLDVHIENVTTEGWDGEYVWVNTSDDDNDGRMKELRMRVRTVDDPVYGQYPEISIVTGGVPYRFFPIFDLGQEVAGWIDWDSDTDYGECYRQCAALINTMDINPSDWKLERIEISPSRVYMAVTSRAMIVFQAHTDSTFEFYENGEGRRCLRYMMGGDDVFRMVAFMNPVDGSPAYVLEEVLG